MNFIDTIKEKASKQIKTIVLPEATDLRVIQAASIITKEGFANIVLLGDEEEIRKLAQQNDLNVEKVNIINPIKSSKYLQYAKDFYELRKMKGIDFDKAKKLLEDPVYFGMMMLKEGDCDGLVSGAIHSTADTLRPALQILKTLPNTKLVSAFFIMVIPDCKYGENGIFIFSDCGLNSNPTAEELSEIAISSSKSFKQLVGKIPKVAMLSYSYFL